MYGVGYEIIPSTFNYNYRKKIDSTEEILSKGKQLL